VHLAILALLLKAAVPMLASAAARLQGVPVGQVCEVYGVALVAPTAAQPHAGHAGHEHHAVHAEPSEPAPKPPGHDTGAHHGDHCALGALAALAPFFSGAAALPSAAPWQVPDTGPGADAFFRDASAAWVARLKHGPPSAQT
jgi:hypothetical protein